MTNFTGRIIIIIFQQVFL